MDKKKIGLITIIVLVIIAALIFMFTRSDDNTFVVAFDNEGVVERINVDENGIVKEPSEPTREGYVFEGWYYNGTKFDFTTKVTGNITLEARWTKKDVQKWVVTFNTNGGQKIASLNVEDGNKIKDIPTPTRSGYTFTGWYYNGEAFDFSMPITSDITLKAEWKVISSQTTATSYIVTFDAAGGTTVASQTVKKNKTAVEPVNPTREGYTFAGWYNGNVKFDFTTKITKNITLTAKWEKAAQEVIATTYTVKFDSAGGTTVANQIVEEGKTAVKPENPTREGYTFVGWYYNDAAYNFSTKVINNILLIAKWQKNDVVTYLIEETESYVGQVKIFVLKNGVKVDGIVDITLNNGTKIENKEISKDGYITNTNKIKDITNVRTK